MAAVEIPAVFIRRYISSAINVIIHIARLADGTRRLLSLQEITGMEGDIITLQEIFSFQQTNIDSQGKVRGRFRYHGVLPKFVEKFKVAGIPVSHHVFDTNNVLEI
jgi:pilus assembly protein CpaF